ncbi:MAG: hypothetical protein J6Y23_14085 [Prevotella sp.]|nr:hypothetical protein [Prevotella sp.]
MKRQYDKQGIAQLLSKFMAGETSLAEEQVLAQYFRTHEVDEEWTEYKEMFTLFDNGEVDIELETETSEQINNGDSGKIRMLPKTVREKPKIVALKWLTAVAAACVLLLLVFHFRQNQAEEKPVVAKVVEHKTPQTVSQPTSPSIVEEKKDEQLAEVQATSQPVKKQRRAVKRRNAQEKPMLAEAEPKQESTEPVNHPDGSDTTPAFSSPVEDPFLLAAAQAQNIRSRGERLHQEISMLMNNP